MNDVNNRIFREFSEFLDSLEKDCPELSVSMAYEITIKSTIASAMIVLASEKQMEERYWNHLRVQRNVLDFLYNLWLAHQYSLVAEFSTTMKRIVESDFLISESVMKERMQTA